MLIFYCIWFLWFLSEIVLNRLRHSGNSGPQSKDSGSMRWIWRTIALAMTLGITASFLPWGTIGNSFTIRYIGLGILVAGMLLRFSAVWSLGRMFTVDVAIRKDHALKKEGLYKLIRHPSYAGSLLSFIGFSFTLNSLWSLVIIILPVFLAFHYRIAIEEKVLSEQFGEEYAIYRRRTYRMIPWLY